LILTPCAPVRNGHRVVLFLRDQRLRAAGRADRRLPWSRRGDRCGI